MITLDIESINKLIVFWRDKRNIAIYQCSAGDQLVAECYIDAFQTIRVNHGLDILK